MTEAAPAVSAAPTCWRCGAAVPPSAAFCEACGSPLTPTLSSPEDDPDELAAPIELSRGLQPAAEPPLTGADTARPCVACGGTVGPDGYCETCGLRAPSERDHYTEQPAPWVAACCDRGIKHRRNEDATAVAADPEPGSRAVLVVCDGVSTSTDSDVASLAAARRARDVLVAARSEGLGTPASRAAAASSALVGAAAEANAAVLASTPAEQDNAASCTFAAAVVESGQLSFGNVGDSRVYWVPDPGSAEQAAELSVDDSLAQARIAMGVAREEAEHGPQAHAITKWLGRDSPDVVPRTGRYEPVGPGWVLVCSDGLWNYASAAADLQALIGSLGGGSADPLALARDLVAWANQQGGKDNISVALARL